MTSEVLNQKIESLRNCVQRIESKVPFALKDLKQNFDLQDIVSVNLQRAVQVCVDIGVHLLAEAKGPAPSTMAESFEQLRAAKIISPRVQMSLAKSVGLRNMLVHAYSKINWKIVHEVCHKHLGVFKRFAAEISNLRS